MISVSEADSILAAHPWVPELQHVQTDDALGRFLAADIGADRDLPPYNRVAMDGVAFRFSELGDPVEPIEIAGLCAAGQPQQQLPSGRVAMEVMTGAVLPHSADTVVRYEDVRLTDGKVQLVVSPVKSGLNVHAQGSDVRAGDIILRKGTRISSAEIPLLASVGCVSVAVWSLPRVAVVSTGDELVDVAAQPLPHQIRRSNSAAISAGLKTFGVAASVFHFGDHDPDVRVSLDKIIRDHDLIILTGGVSKGKFDWVPSALAAAGLEKHFHEISQRPGKPLWFGSGHGRIAFAFPGNPVSTFMCLYRYLIPWLIDSFRQAGKPDYLRQLKLNAVLAADFHFDAPLTYFLQVRTEFADGMLKAFPLPGGGSGDFANLRHVDGFLELPLGGTPFRAGTVFPYFPFRPL